MAQKFILYLVVASVSCIGQTNPEQADRLILSRTVELKAHRGTSVEAAVALLTQANVTGGIVSRPQACASPRERDLSLSKTTLEKGLEYLSSESDFRSWVFMNGQIVVGNDALTDTLLDVSLNDADLEMDQPLSLSTQQLLRSKQVRAKIAKLGIEDLGPALGFGKLNTSRPRPKAPAVKRLRNVSLYQALNSLAAENGHAVWLYEEFRCGKRFSFRIAWVAQ